jgi:hypothetical protein
MSEPDREKQLCVDMEYEGAVRGGIFYRAFDLHKFIKRVEEEKKVKFVGIGYSGTPNIEILYAQPEDEGRSEPAEHVDGSADER